MDSSEGDTDTGSPDDAITAAAAKLVNSDDSSAESEMMESASWKLNMAESRDGSRSIDTDVLESDAFNTDSDSDSDSDSDGISVERDDDNQGKRIVPKSFGQRRGNSVEIVKR